MQVLHRPDINKLLLLEIRYEVSHLPRIRPHRMLGSPPLRAKHPQEPVRQPS